MQNSVKTQTRKAGKKKKPGKSTRKNRKKMKRLVSLMRKETEKTFSLRKKQPRFFGIFFGEIPVSGQSDIQEAGRIRPEKKHEQRRV